MKNSSATVIQHARLVLAATSESLLASEKPRAAIILIDGNEWTSPLPKTSGEAEDFNRIADRIADDI